MEFKFAGDTAVMSTGASDHVITSFNNYLNQLGRWLLRWKAQANSDKCQSVYFTRRRSTPNPPKLYRRPIPGRDETKYLGVALDKRLTYKTYVAEVKNKVTTENKKTLLCDGHSRNTKLRSFRAQEEKTSPSPAFLELGTSEYNPTRPVLIRTNSEMSLHPDGTGQPPASQTRNAIYTS
ncbi:hypothetical protein AVEN_166987-1 [Araneus ventricosus]|uniref:Reverse transcriptase domain-containing protein n=1 Tax=Araneus ventricosus TaxID=182803 RepID=A0A4Y2H0W0_ARAVE|nr:hypothetical protein AVEN_166987-1 [Araneus ventricosus]